MNEDQNDSTDPGEPSMAEEDSGRIRIVEEIDQLSNIPEIKEYFFRAILEARHIFRDKIKEYRYKKIKSNPDEVIAASKKHKTYFFEMSRVEDPKSASGFRWDLEKHKLPKDEIVIIMILDDFIKKLEEYEVAPHRVQEEKVPFQPLDKWFHIRFTKGSPTRVVGYVKEVEKAREKIKEEKTEEKKKFVVKSNKNMLKIATETTKRKEDLEEFLHENPGFRDDILYSIEMKLASELPN